MLLNITKSIFEHKKVECKLSNVARRKLLGFYISNILTETNLGCSSCRNLRRIFDWKDKNHVKQYIWATLNLYFSSCLDRYQSICWNCLLVRYLIGYKYTEQRILTAFVAAAVVVAAAAAAAAAAAKRV